MATISNTEQPHMQQIDLMKLSLPQLQQLRQQLDQVGNKLKHLGAKNNFSEFLGARRFSRFNKHSESGENQISSEQGRS